MATTMATQYLNPELWVMLQNRFGTVRVSNQGQRRIVQTGTDMFNSEKKVKKDFGGEHYAVCCPFCNDSRFRLYISYLWNTVDEKGRKLNRGLIHCFNEDCDCSNFEMEFRVYNRDEFLNVRHRYIKDPYRAVNTLTEVSLPGKCVPLKDLEETHPAIAYIKQREFDPKELSVRWGLTYCVQHTNPMVADRIIIPIYWNKKLVGWQARAIGRSPVKYFTMPGLAKSSILFNGDVALTKKYVVVVEGVFDAFRVGDHAVALLGKVASHLQRGYLVNGWGGNNGAICVMLDADAQADIDRTVQLLANSVGDRKVFSVRLPDGKDPGSTPKSLIQSFIASAARSSKITLMP